MAEETQVKRVGCYLCNRGHCGLLAYVNTKTGKIVRVKGNPEHPVSRGFTCVDRVPHILKWLYHPDQLNYPLKRVGERGEDKWERITWDQALDEIATKLKELKKEHGPECLAVCEGTYRSDLYWARARFLNLFGNPANVFDPGTICSCNCVAIQYAIMGAPTHVPDIFNAKCLVFWGRNPPDSEPMHWWRLLDRKRKGDSFKLIVIDPRFTESARNADVWLQLRPGTDGALAIGWLDVIISEGLYDKEFVENWTNAPFLVQSNVHRILREEDVMTAGSSEKYVVWDNSSNSPVIYDPETSEHKTSTVKPALIGVYSVMLASGKKVECKTVWQLLMERVSEYSPERVQETTWVPAERIRESARLYAMTKPACIYRGVATDQIGRNSGRVEQARIILRAITGNLDVRGGDVLMHPTQQPEGKMVVRDSMLQLEEALPPESRKKQIGSDTFKIMTWPAYEMTNKHYKRVWGIPQCMSGHNILAPTPLLWRAILTRKPYPIKALITWSSNPMLWASNTKLVYRALKSSDLELHVVLEHFMTPTAQLADYVLPVASKMFERPWCSTYEDFISDVSVWEKAIEPLGERRTEYEFFRGLAVRLGFGQHFPWKTLEEVIEYRLSPLGISFQGAVKTCVITQPFEPRMYAQTNLRTGRLIGFATPTGRVELYSTVFELLGYDPLPHYEEPPEGPISTPQLIKGYPLILNTGGRFRPMFHSEHRQWGTGMRELHPNPIVEIHPHTALRYGIADGDWVWIETRRGRIKQRVRLTTSIHPRVVNAEASWWFPEQPGEEPWLHGVWESNANVLTPDELETLDPLTGGWCHRALLCRIYKVKKS
jgi:anaerobic selenocysteine-containing dehydrogenase